MGISEFRSLEQQCAFDKIIGLTPLHIDLIMNHSINEYYLLRSEQVKNNVKCEEKTNLDLEQEDEDDGSEKSE